MSNYAEIIKHNLDRLYHPIAADLAQKLPAEKDGKNYIFRAFGKICQLGPEGIQLADEDENGPLGVIISLYALQAH